MVRGHFYEARGLGCIVGNEIPHPDLASDGPRHKQWLKMGANEQRQ